MASGYKNLIVWQKAMKLTVAVYAATGKFPKQEQFGLTSQLQRAAVSIPSNIAEGSSRGDKDFHRFLTIAFGSGMEVETQLIIAKELNYLSEETCHELTLSLEEVMRMLNKLRSSKLVTKD